MNLYSLKKQYFSFLIISIASLFLAGCSQSDPVVEGIYEGFGDYHRSMTTDSVQAQALLIRGYS